MRKLKILALQFMLLTHSSPLYANKVKAKSTSKLNIQELALPSEVEGLPKSTGSIFYNPSVKGKVLVPVHFWGEIGKSGLHFLPTDTTLVKGISMAGGPSSNAILNEVRLTRRVDGKLKNKFFDLTDGGEDKAHLYALQPGDTVFIERSRFYEDRSYYTAMIGVAATFLSTILLYREVKK